MKSLLIATATLMAMTAPAFAAGDADKGKKTFGRCKSCHRIEATDGTMIVKGGKTGPNLYGVIGRTAGADEGFSYSSDLAAVGENGLVWDAESLAAFVTDPKGYLKEATGSGSAKTKMTFKLKSGGDDVAAYLTAVAAE